HSERRRDGADERSEGEQPHRGEEQAAGGELLDEEAGDRDHHDVDEHEDRRQPLYSAGGDVEIRHEHRQRRFQQRMVDDYDEGAREENTENDVAIYRGGATRHEIPHDTNIFSYE